jgi:hypothetical protein
MEFPVGSELTRRKRIVLQLFQKLFWGAHGLRKFIIIAKYNFQEQVIDDEQKKFPGLATQP